MAFNLFRPWSHGRTQPATQDLPPASESLVELNDSDLRFVSGGADPRTLLDRSLNNSTALYGSPPPAAAKA